MQIQMARIQIKTYAASHSLTYYPFKYLLTPSHIRPTKPIKAVRRHQVTKNKNLQFVVAHRRCNGKYSQTFIYEMNTVNINRKKNTHTEHFQGHCRLFANICEVNRLITVYIVYNLSAHFPNEIRKTRFRCIHSTATFYYG